jgi:hypothetical protein
MTDQIMTLAEGLAGGTGRYVDDKRLRAAGRKFGLSFDDARRAGIIADRLRRERGSQVIPNHRIGSVAANQNSAPANIHVTFGTSVDNNGNILPFVESVTQKNISRAAPRIVGAAVTEAGRRVVPSLAKHQTQKAGGDWRNGG